MQAIIDAMRLHAAVPTMAESGCAALRALALHQDNRVALAECGGIPAVVSAMQAHPAEKGVQAQGAGALWHVMLDNIPNKHSVALGGGSAALVAALVRYRELVQVVTPAAAALQSLLVLPQYQETVAAAGALAAVLQCWRDQVGHPGCQTYLCGILMAMTRVPDNRAQLVAADGLNYLQQTMVVHESLANVTEYAVGICRNLAADRCWHPAMLQAGLVPLVLQVCALPLTHSQQPTSYTHTHCHDDDVHEHRPLRGTRCQRVSGCTRTCWRAWATGALPTRSPRGC